MVQYGCRYIEVILQGKSIITNKVVSRCFRARLRKVKCVIQDGLKYVADFPRHLRGPMHKVPKEKAAKANMDGKNILKKSTFVQIRTRLYYE